MQRHFDDGKPLDVYADEIAVLCPNCQKPGTVAAQWQPYRWQANFCCGHCALQLDSARDDWRGPVSLYGRRPCGFCGHKWISVEKTYAVRPANPPKLLRGTCPQCRHVSEVSVESSPWHSAEAIDPHFGLPLRLVTTTRQGPVWVYNGRHLQALQDYTLATLRERGACTNRSMFSRLPAWMKLARNRETVLRALKRLQQKLLQP